MSQWNTFAVLPYSNRAFMMFLISVGKRAWRSPKALLGF